jgi:glutaredoxin
MIAVAPKIRATGAFGFAVEFVADGPVLWDRAAVDLVFVAQKSGVRDTMHTVARRILSTFDQLERPTLDLHTLFEFVGGNVPSDRETVLDAVTNLVKDGLLTSEGGGDFYRRTEEGRLALAAPRDVTMYMREGCHLCEEAKSAMAPVLAALGARLQEVDIDDDPILRNRYTNDVPVVFVGPCFFAQHRIDAARLRRRLENAKL